MARNPPPGMTASGPWPGAYTFCATMYRLGGDTG